MLGAWVGRAERGTSQESELGVCGEEGGLGAKRGVVGGAYGSLERGQGGPRGRKDKGQGFGFAVWKKGGEGARSRAEARRMVCAEYVCKHLGRECGPGGLLGRAVAFLLGVWHCVFWRILTIHSHLRALVL